MTSDLSGQPVIDIEAGAILLAGPDTIRDLPPSERFLPDHSRASLTRIGVRSADGLVSRFGTDIYWHRRSRPVHPRFLSRPVTTISEPLLYGGVIGSHFGHQLTQSLGRLWVSDAHPQRAIAYLNATPGFQEIPDYFITVLRRLGIAAKVRLICEPAQVEDLLVPQDLCNLHRSPSVTPFFADWLAARRPAVALDPGLRLYVSRSGLPVAQGQYLQETMIEAALVQQGYRILRPEQTPINEQIDQYLAASALIFADGSAAHLWSLFGHPDQRAAMILRRPMDRHIERWFGDMQHLAMAFLDHRVADFFRRGGTTGWSAALLDLSSLWEDLRARGFHTSADGLGLPRAELNRWIELVQTGARPGASCPFPLDDRSQLLLAHRPRVLPSVIGEGISPESDFQ